jgi:hypothetical protein
MGALKGKIFRKQIEKAAGIFPIREPIKKIVFITKIFDAHCTGP